MDAANNIATDLFYKVRSRFQGLKLGEATGQITINPESARFFDFDYTEGDNAIGHVSISLAEPNSMKVYFSTGITEGMDDGQKENWYKFLKELREFAKRRLLAFDTRDIAKDNLDKRDYTFLSQNALQNNQKTEVGESMMNESNLYGTKTMSYQKLEDTRLIIKHSKAVMDDTTPGARSRNISALFVENQDGERFKYPFVHLAGARAMQRHVANGGLPYDAVGESIIKMSEEIAQLKSFSNYVVRNDLMNSDTNEVVMRGQIKLDSLRETISKIAKQAHYEAYVENFQSADAYEMSDEMMEDFKNKFTVRSFNEEMTDVFPVLARLMAEETTVGYDDIVGETKEEDIEEKADKDHMANFENWVMGLGEDSPIQSSDDDERQTAIKSLNALVGEVFPAGIDGMNALESLHGIIDDPRLEQDIKRQAKESAESDVRPLVKAWIEENAPEALDQLDFGDMSDEPAVGADQIEPPTESTEEGFDPDEFDGEFEMEVGGDDGEEETIYVSYMAKVEDGRPVVDPESLKASSAESNPSARVDDSWASEMVSPNGDEHEQALEIAQQDAEEQWAERDNKYDQGESADDQEGMTTSKLAEFIFSFYDRESGTFPKGPEGVATMVGKKFGEQAEAAARKMVERMAPVQDQGAEYVEAQAEQEADDENDSIAKKINWGGQYDKGNDNDDNDSGMLDRLKKLAGF